MPFPDLDAQLPALLTGLTAGLAVAMPLGAIGVLVLQEAMTRGLRVAAAGAAGIAVVDTIYAIVAVVAGAWVSSALAGHEATVRVVGAIALAGVAGWGIVRSIRGDGSGDGGGGAREDGVDAAPGRRPAPASAAAGPRAAVTFARFVALTAVNPLTAAAFAVIATGFADRWPTSADKVAFVVGVGVASLGWQLLLSVAGAALGARAGARTRRLLGLTGFAMVGVLAVLLATG